MDEMKKTKDESKKEKQNEKIKKEKEKLEELEKVNDELQKLFDDLSELVGEDNGGVKVIKVNIPSKKERIINSIYKFIFSVILIIALSGFLNWCNYDNVYLFLVYVCSVALLELIIEKIITKYFIKYLVYSLGSLNLLAPILSFVILFFTFPFITMKNVILFIFVIILYMIIKKIFVRLIENIKTSKNTNIKE